jgi:tRNA modification GTPase
VKADTVFALSSGRPPAALSVIRVSGAEAHAAGTRLAGRLPLSRRAALRVLRNAAGEILDEALVLRFDGPASSTGEDIVEFQCHGSRAVVDAVLAELSSVAGLREAVPGEFTRRAFENGRIDLTEAEGLADLLEAETESQRKAALAMAEGGLRRQVGIWQQRVLQLSARAEASIDYVEDDGVDPDPALLLDCATFADELSSWLDRPRVEPLKDGIRVVVAGPPNAGKSSLVNAIAGQERAIVTAIPGTTRDHIEVPLSIGGVPVLLTDTAGLRETADPLERIGVDRAQQIVEGADIVVWMGEPEDAPSARYLLLVHGRCDLADRQQTPEGSLAVSSVSGHGIPTLLQKIGGFARMLLPLEGALALNRRQAAHVEEARNALRHCAGVPDVVLIAEDLRAARGAFDRLTGRAGVEDLLDALFSRFCLGK